ncbi:sensor histidine kinase [Crossiella sp. CA-258035]|uniref:sensor histidine kinase n=1 Tax=Crossiella sp. CA-258035 TaxID=2981138 RepID=UPI0024BC1BB3|nr:sensor histidine kinase [Crossiella sp. CA-258035]WHT17849.1 sensor histidine kinase [Crossiella sp. CA-258035]
MSVSWIPRFGSRALLVVDGLVAIAVVIVTGLRTSSSAMPFGGAVTGWVLAVAVGTPLAVRWWRPTVVFGLVLGAAGVAIAIGVAGEVVVLAVAYALYPVALGCPARQGVGAMADAGWRLAADSARQRTVLSGVPAGPRATGSGHVALRRPTDSEPLPRSRPQPATVPTGSARRAAVVLAVALGVVTGAGLVSAIGPVVSVPGVESFSQTPVSASLYSWVVLGSSWALARAVRVRRDHAAQVAELVARRAVVAERLRIARDIHDVVGHNLSLIALRAAVANHLADDGRTALTEIEAISRRALADVRSVLGAVRDPDDPEPGAATLDQLIADSRAAGLEVEFSAVNLTVAPEAVRVSAYRIVQEALTNVVRHARTKRCRVRLAVEKEVVLVEITDDGPARGPMGPPGQGLVGMRERAALHQGSVVAGPRPEGGFAVRARLPLRPGDGDE